MIAETEAAAVPPEPHAASPLLHTKLAMPRAAARLVARSRLTDRLATGVGGRLTVVSAPAGFGKTTLLGQWLADTGARGRGVAWVSLDASENEPGLFWSYVVQSLASVHPSIGAGSLPLLRSGGATIDAALTVLLNEIARADTDVVLVLDDYHVIESPAIHEALAFFIDRQPPRSHVVVASRFDPPLPLARLRARGELTELSAEELRFRVDETSALLNEVMSLALSQGEVADLERRTEGWVTALKLAALGGGRAGSDAERAFRGRSGYIADYVIDEVLRAEPAYVRDFLLATSVLERLGGPLCDEVAQRRDSRRLLDDLARRNLFVVALDDDGTWYRYHHLFADVLQAHAKRVDPESVRAAHGRASGWYASHGLRIEAVGHALDAGDPERAADLLEVEWPARNRSHESSRWLRQARLLPDALLAARPLLAMGYAWALLNGGEADAAEVPLRHVADWLAQRDPAALGTARERALPAELAAARAYRAQMAGDVDGTIAHARRSLELMAEDDHVGRITGTALVALALWSDGRLEEAHDTFDAALGHMRRAGHKHDALRGIFVLGDLRAEQGRLRDAAAIYEAGLREAALHDGGSPPEIDELYIGLAEVHCERGELERAGQLLEQVREWWTRTRHRAHRERWCTAMARIRIARGDFDGALALLDEAETHHVPGPLPPTRPTGAIRTRVLLAQGRVAEAKSWVASSPLSAQDEPTYTREYELLTLARVLVAQSGTAEGGAAIGDAIALLERVADVAERAGRIGSLIDALAARAIAQAAAGRPRPALDALARALELAEPEGYLRVFADEGTPMRDLLRHALARGVAPEPTRRVLAAFPAAAAAAAGAAAGTAPGELTPREVLILRLLATGLRNQEIAEHLFISPATVKRHIANIYLKLQVSHRTAALARAAELKIL